MKSFQQDTERNLLNMRNFGSAIATILILTACGGSQSQEATEADEAAASAPAPTEPAGQSPAEESTDGSAAFTVDGSEKSFGFLPKSACVYNPLASTLRAHSEAGSTESIAIHFMSIDLKKLTYPTELPLPRDPSQPMDPMAAMASVGFGYINAEGVEWAGPGKIQIESFGNDGVIRGTFDQVSLPDTDKEHPDMALTNGSFSARITSPW